MPLDILSGFWFNYSWICMKYGMLRREVLNKENKDLDSLRMHDVRFKFVKIAYAAVKMSLVVQKLSGKSTHIRLMSDGDGFYIRGSDVTVCDEQQIKDAHYYEVEYVPYVMALSSIQQTQKPHCVFLIEVDNFYDNTIDTVENIVRSKNVKQAVWLMKSDDVNVEVVCFNETFRTSSLICQEEFERFLESKPCIIVNGTASLGQPDPWPAIQW